MRCRCVVREDGFTLIEMIIVMAVFIIVLMISANAFKTVLTKSKEVTKSEESNIEGIVGLEMFRHDLIQAGFGLFNDMDSTISAPTYSEAVASIYAANFNDMPNGIPRPIIGADNLSASNGLAGTDYLVIKATTIGRTLASQKWTYVDGVGTSKTWSSGVNDLKDGVDYVIAVKQAYRNGEMRRRLIYNPTTTNSFAVAYRSDGVYVDPFRPNTNGVQYYYYGIDEVDPRAPFNRTDYVVMRLPGEVPSSCAPSAGVLYKATMKQGKTGDGGQFTSIPVLDCVADMQVIFGWNTSDPAGSDVDTYSKPDGSTPTGAVLALPALDADYIRKHLKQIKVYILAQDGGYDPSFTNTNNAMVVGDAKLGETILTHSVDLTAAGYQHYRWKLYRIVVQPKNLI